MSQCETATTAASVCFIKSSCLPSQQRPDNLAQYSTLQLDSMTRITDALISMKIT